MLEKALPEELLLLQFWDMVKDILYQFELFEANTAGEGRCNHWRC